MMGRASKGVEVLACVTALSAFLVTNVYSIAVTLNTPDPRIPCISLEMALPIVKVQNSPPSTLDMSFKFDIKQIYAEKYGQKSTTSKQHEKTLKCAIQVGGEIEELIDHFIVRVLNFIAMRKESYIADGENYDNHDKQTTERLTRTIEMRESDKNLDHDFRERKSFKLGREISRWDSRLSFDEVWLEEQVRGDLSKGTNSTDHWTTDAKGRSKRMDPASVVAIIVALVALSASASSTLFLGARLEKLVDYVDSLSEAVNKDWDQIKLNYKNLVLMKDGYGSIAAGAHYMTQVIQKLINYNLCHTQQTRLILEMRSIVARLDGIFESLVSGRFNLKILPLSLLREIFTHSSLSNDVLSGAIPTTFYQGASLSVLSADRDKKSVQILFTSPRIEREPSYRVLRLHSVSGTISVNGQIYDRIFGFDGEEIAIPNDLYEKHHQDMMMDASEVQQLRQPSECSFMNGLYGCRSFLTLPTPISVCLIAIFARDWPSILEQCQIRMIPQDRHHVVSTSTGSTGMLISCNATFRLFGLDHQKPTHYQRDDLTKMATRDSSKGLCSWVDSHYSTVQVVDEHGKMIDEIEQDTKLVVRQGFVQDITKFSEKHYHFYDRKIELDGSLLNFTGYQSEIDKNWSNLEEHDHPIFRLRSQSGYFEIGITIVVACILCLYALKLVRCLRQRFVRPTAREAADVRGRIDYHASQSGPPSVAVSLPSRPPPPPPPSHAHDHTDSTSPKYQDPRSLNDPSSDSRHQMEIEDRGGPSSPPREPPITPHPAGWVGGKDSLPPRSAHLPPV